MTATVLYLALVVSNTPLVPSPESLLETYRKETQAVIGRSFKLHFRETYEGPTRLNNTTLREGTYRISHDQGRWKIDFDGAAYEPNGGSPPIAKTEKFEVLFAGANRYLEVLCDGRNAEPRHVTAILEGAAERDTVFTLDCFPVLFGTLPGNDNKPFIDVLTNSQLEVVREGQGWRLDSKSEFGRASLWFEGPNASRLHHLTIRKGRGDLMNKVVVGSQPATAANAYYPAGTVAGYETTYSVVRTVESGGINLPAEFEYTTITEFVGGQKVTIRFRATISDFRSVAEGDFEIVSAIPNGFGVQVDDQPNIEYEWRGGQIVKAISAAARENLLTSRFGSSFSIAGYFLSFSIVVLLLTTLLVWRYRRAES